MYHSLGSWHSGCIRGRLGGRGRWPGATAGGRHKSRWTLAGHRFDTVMIPVGEFPTVFWKLMGPWGHGILGEFSPFLEKLWGIHPWAEGNRGTFPPPSASEGGMGHFPTYPEFPIENRQKGGEDASNFHFRPTTNPQRRRGLGGPMPKTSEVGGFPYNKRNDDWCLDYATKWGPLVATTDQLPGRAMHGKWGKRK